jgi:hypothetical protein
MIKKSKKKKEVKLDNNTTIAEAMGERGKVKMISSVEPSSAIGNIELEAGSNVTIQPDYDNNKVKISATGGGGSADGIKTINSVTPTTQGAFTIGAGSNVTIGTTANGITINSTSGSYGVQTVNEMTPDENGNLTIEGQYSIAVEEYDHKIVIHSTAPGPVITHLQGTSGLPMWPDEESKITLNSPDGSISIQPSGQSYVHDLNFTVGAGVVKKISTKYDGDISPDSDGKVKFISSDHSLNVKKTKDPDDNTDAVDITYGIQFTEGVRIASSATGTTTTVVPKTSGNDRGLITIDTDLISFANPLDKTNWKLLTPNSVVKSVNGVSPTVSGTGSGDGSVTIPIGVKTVGTLSGDVGVVSSDSSVDISVTQDNKLDLKAKPTASDREYNRSMCEIISEGTGYTGVKDLLTGHTEFDFPLKSKVPPEYPCPATTDAFLDVYYSSYIDQVMAVGPEDQKLQGPFYMYAEAPDVTKYSCIAIATNVSGESYVLLQVRIFYRLSKPTGTITTWKDFFVGPPESAYPQKVSINLTEELKESGMYPVSFVTAKFALMSSWPNHTDWKFQPYLIIFGHIFYRYTYLI